MARRVFRGDDSHVGFAELLFDLVFVFAITQLSALLRGHYDPEGAAETAFLFLAVWWSWIYTTWVLNRLDPERPKVRALLFALMLAGLFLSMALPQAFHARGLVFAASYCSMQLLRTAFMWAVIDTPGLRRGYVRIMIWAAVAAAFWLSGAGVELPDRAWLWGCALGIEYLGPISRFWVPGIPRREVPGDRIKGGHIAERCALFVIICLGEALLITGASFSNQEWHLAATLAFLASFVQATAMWWVYFHIGHRRATHHIEKSEHPADLARVGYTYLHIPIVAGIIVAAVGAQRGILNPMAAATPPELASVVGGLALFLLGNGFFKWQSSRYFPLSHLVGLGLTAVLAYGGLWAGLLVANAAAAAILVQVAVWEHWSWARGAKGKA